MQWKLREVKSPEFIDSYFPDDDAVEKIYKQMKSKAGQFFKKVTPLSIKMATRGAISNNEDLKDLFDFDSSSKEEVTKFLSDLIEDEIRDYDSKKKSITGFKASLAEFADTILSKNGSTPPLIIFIDELDRCRPNFALELLENIKHIFDVEKIGYIRVSQLVNY